MGPKRLKEPKHLTQKPVRLLKHLVNIASNDGDVILDPFMGVGSTGVAALEMNRKFIGIEIEKEYFEAAQKRLDYLETDLFTVPNKNEQSIKTF